MPPPICLGQATPFISHAQNFEDVMLWRALRHVGRGFYIDVGACEPDADSVTLAFYERGWRGINLEPAPAAFARLDAARPRDINLAMAAAATDGEADFLLVDGGNGLSTLRTDTRAALEADWPVTTIRTRIRRLATICREQGVAAIHFLKIDAEGAERAVLEGADLANWRPWIVVVEATAPNTPTPAHAEWEGLLLAARYRMAYDDGLNRFYLAEEHAALAPAFATPPNVFDGFIRHAEHAALAQAEAGRAQAAHLASQLATLTATHDQLTATAVTHAAHLAAANAATSTARLATERAAALTAQLTTERDHALQELWETNRLAAALALDRQKLLDERAVDERDRAAIPNQQLAAVHASTSWRITAPLRLASRALARLRR